MVKCLSHLILLSPFFTYGKLTDACWKCWDENAAACPTVCAGPGAHTATQTSAFEVAEAGAFWPTGDRSSKQEVRLGSLETGPRGAVSPVLHSREPDLPHPPRCHIYLALKTCHPNSPFTFNDVCFYLHSTFVKNFQNLEIRQKESYMPFQCHLRAFYNISTQGSSHTLEEDNFVWLIIYYLIRAQIFKNWMPNCGRFICCK